MKILLVDDEEAILKIVKIYLEKEGYGIFTAQNAESAKEIFYNEKIDLLILDWMLPKVSGINLCEEFKRNRDVKIIMLTAKIEVEDELKALFKGADDYIRKPFDPRILVARVNKLLKKEERIRFKDLEIDIRGNKVYRNNDDLLLKNKEFQLLIFFLNNKNIILSREKILDNIWGYDYFGEDRTVDTHIRRLRKKIGENLIKTYRNMGYSLED